MNFEVLRINSAYEIGVEYPHPIRKISTQRIISEYIKDNGYIQLNLSEVVNGRRVQRKHHKHRLIATQFIENPEDLDFVDHINHNRLDNRIVNLRWCSASENARNKTSMRGVVYEYVDEISDEAVVVRDYGQHLFEDYFYVPDEDKFYFYNGVQYRRLHVNENENGSFYVRMRSTEGRSVNVYISKFRMLYGFN